MPLTLAFIHTSHVLIPAFSALAQREMPDVECFHMVDESLIKNTIKTGGLAKTTIRRVGAMVASAREGGADAVLVTCSSIGAAVPAVRGMFDFPVLRVDEAMAEQAVGLGRRVGVVATLRTTLDPTVKLLRDKAVEAGRPIEVAETLCEGAFEAVLAGDTETHDRLVSAAITTLSRKTDVVVLAQASMARVVAGLPADVLETPILSSPELAVRRARAVLLG